MAQPEAHRCRHGTPAGLPAGQKSGSCRNGYAIQHSLHAPHAFLDFILILIRTLVFAGDIKLVVMPASTKSEATRCFPRRPAAGKTWSPPRPPAMARGYPNPG